MGWWWWFFFIDVGKKIVLCMRGEGGDDVGKKCA
jgi:hypothetical protein